MKGWLLVMLLGLFSIQAAAQGCFPDDADPVITLDCAHNCTDLNFIIPDIRQTTSYRVVDIPYNPEPLPDIRDVTRLTFTGGWPGNSYSAVQNLPFDFCFYGNTYNKFVVGSNGTISFDETQANQWCDPLLIRGNATFPLPSSRYPGALIAAVMHDLDPGDTSRSVPDRRIDYIIEGTAPCRRMVLNFYKVPLWPGPQRNCQSSLNTNQVIIYESTGIIDVFVKDAPQCQGSNLGYNTLAIQNMDRTASTSPRGKNCSQWGGTNLNLGYRFVPSGGNSQLLSADLLVNGRPAASGNVTAGTVQGTLNVNFPSFCPNTAASVCVLHATYSNCTGNGVIDLYDTIYVNKTNSLQATATARPTPCTSSLGSIVVDIPPGAGVPPYQYSLNGGPPQSNNFFSNLPAGTYLVTVTDASVCTDNISVTVDMITTLNVSTSVTPTSCNRASDGAITVNPGGGIVPVRYSLNGGPFQLANTFTGLAPGTYSINVEDGAGCTSTRNNIIVPAGPGLTTSFTSNDISCFGNADGSVQLDPPAAGRPPYQYSLDGTTYQFSGLFAGLAPGNYQAYLTDGNGCTGSVSFVIREPAVLQANTSVSPVQCFGNADGMINVTTSGGTAPFQYSLDNVNFQSTNQFAVPAGNYTVYVKDAHQCTTIAGNNLITQPAMLRASATSTNATCNGGADGTITVTANGGTPGYMYSINGTDFQASPVFQLTPGSYSVTVQDQNGCSTLVSGIVVGLTNNLTLSVAPVAPFCEGGSVQLLATSNATVYSWTPSASLNDPSIANPVASPTTTTNYTVNVQLGQCSAQEQVAVAVKAAPVPDAGPPGDICVGQQYQLQGSGGVGYLWSPATALNDVAVANPIASPAQTITYSLSVTGANGCSSLSPATVLVHVTPPIHVSVSPADTIVNSGDRFQLHAWSAGDQYTWSPATGLDNPAVADPMVTAGAAGTVYQYSVTATTSAGCKGDAAVTVRVYKGPELYVPTAFTPNGDGRNDLFFPFPVGIKELSFFRVYSRWGEILFSTTRTGQGWDGTYKGIKQNPGVYVWEAQGVTVDGQIISRKGTVTLIR